MLYSLGQHEALLSVQDSLLPDEKLFAYLDDLYVVLRPRTRGSDFQAFRTDFGGTCSDPGHIWGRFRSGIVGVMSLPGATHSRQPLNWWTHTPESGVDMGSARNRGSGCWASRLVTPTLSRPSSEPPPSRTELSSSASSVCKICRVHGSFFFFARTRGQHTPSEASHQWKRHNWRRLTMMPRGDCCMKLLGLPFSTEGQDVASLPFDLGGRGLRSATRSSVAAHWASWADSLRMIHRRHPGVADTMIRCLSEPDGLRHFTAATHCQEDLRDLGFAAPEWRPLATALPRRLAERLFRGVEHSGAGMAA